jgi:hypothetical protein
MTTVLFHGVEVAADYPARVLAAQAVTTYTLNGRRVLRVPYGREEADLPAPWQPCPDCAVLTSQLHVPGCEAESCPVCGQQVLSCGCLETPESPATMPSLINDYDDRDGKRDDQ